MNHIHGNIFLSLVVQLNPLELWHMEIADTPKSCKMMFWWFNVIPSFIWGFVLQGFCEESVQQIYRGINSLCPELIWYPLLNQKALVMFLLSDTSFYVVCRVESIDVCMHSYKT